MRKSEDILKAVLAKRGISLAEDVSEFLSDRPKKTYDPFLLLNMEAGVDLLLSEIKKGTRICIYGDYDADGVTSICILSNVLSMLTDNFTYYIPSRFEEGYGLNKEALAGLKNDGVGLVVTVDCGSVSYNEVEYAKEIGLKIIVTDHHSIDDVKADCILINPKQKECSYPFRELAGCGVAFKMAQAIQQKAKLPKSAVNDVLDMAAVGTIADIVSLTDENRTIVKYGLNKINAGSRKSLAELVRAISLKRVDSENIAFAIAPHINAAGRMHHASEAVKLFLTDDNAIIEKQIELLISLNSLRKQKQEEAYNKAMTMVDPQAKFIVINMIDIHEGIAGIVAGKIKESMGRPVIIVTPSEEGFLKGTGRGIETVDIYMLLKKHDELFVRFGGHKSACGFLMPEENLETLREVLESEMCILLEEDSGLFEKTVDWDAVLEPDEVTLDFAYELMKLEPFGQGNPKPAFALKNVRIEYPKFMGADKTHVRFRAVSDIGKRVECVLFQRAQEKADVICASKPVNLVGSVGVQSWQGRQSVQFIVEEITECE